MGWERSGDPASGDTAFDSPLRWGDARREAKRRRQPAIPGAARAVLPLNQRHVPHAGAFDARSRAHGL